MRTTPRGQPDRRGLRLRQGSVSQHQTERDVVGDLRYIVDGGRRGVAKASEGGPHGVGQRPGGVYVAVDDIGEDHGFD